MVVYGYGPEVYSLLSELERRAMASVVIEEDEATARRLHARGQQVVHVTLAEQELDLRPLTRARALVLNGEDDANVLLALSAREVGYDGPIVAMIQDPRRRAPMLLAGANATFIPNHVLAAVLSSRASARISPGLTGVRPLSRLLEKNQALVDRFSL